MNQNKEMSSNHNQKPGFVLLTSIILGSIIMAMALIMVQIMTKELAFNVQLYNTEKAYYRAEGGVETGLLLLNENALNHVEDFKKTDLEGDLEWSLDIHNLVKDSADIYFQNNSLTLGPNQIQTFRYARDNQPDKGYDGKDPGDLKIETDPSGKYSWRFLCKDDIDATRNLQGEKNGGPIDRVKVVSGEYNTSTGGIANGNFTGWSGSQRIDKSSCYLQLQNLSGGGMTFTLTPTAGDSGFAPLRSKLEAKGVSGNQEKVVKFFYDQNGIGTALNFSFINYKIN